MYTDKQRQILQKVSQPRPYFLCRRNGAIKNVENVNKNNRNTDNHSELHFVESCYKLIILLYERHLKCQVEA